MTRAVLALLLMTTAAQADQLGPTFGDPHAFTEQSGEAIYHSICAGCHMPDGNGATGAGIYPSLNANERLGGSTYLIHLALKGQKAMPPFARTLTDAQVAAVVTYIRTHFTNHFADPVTAAEVAAER
jgi:mono/diheme cytochrome c family protein